MRMRMLACLLFMLAVAPEAVRAQSQSLFSNLANPAIGMNALFSARAARSLDEPYGPRFDETELSLIAAVDPYWTLSGDIVFTSDESGPEELWARSTSIPSVQLKLGMLRGTFGKHGLLHTHAFPFVQAPIIMANSIGEEGFKSAGVEASWLVPMPWFAELTGGVYQAREADDEHPLDFGSSRHDNIPFLGHFKNLLELTEATTLECGLSILQGRGTDGLVQAAFGADATVRNVPARGSNRHGWIWQGEYIQRASNARRTYGRQRDGGYVSFQYRASQAWWVGIRGEHNRDCYTDFLVDDAGEFVPGKLTRGSVNVAWAPSEFSHVRLEYSHAEADDGAGRMPNDDRIMIQLSYTIGHHAAHAY